MVRPPEKLNLHKIACWFPAVYISIPRFLMILSRQPVAFTMGNSLEMCCLLEGKEIKIVLYNLPQLIFPCVPVDVVMKFLGRLWRGACFELSLGSIASQSLSSHSHESCSSSVCALNSPASSGLSSMTKNRIPSWTVGKIALRMLLSSMIEYPRLGSENNAQKLIFIRTFLLLPNIHFITIYFWHHSNFSRLLSWMANINRDCQQKIKCFLQRQNKILAPNFLSRLWCYRGDHHIWTVTMI